jgi:hypothetical protein
MTWYRYAMLSCRYEDSPPHHPWSLMTWYRYAMLSCRYEDSPTHHPWSLMTWNRYAMLSCRYEDELNADAANISHQNWAVCGSHTVHPLSSTHSPRVITQCHLILTMHPLSTGHHSVAPHPH